VARTRAPALLARADGEPSTTAILPLLIRSELFGLVELVRDNHEDGAALTDATLPLLGAILNQGAVALETAYLFEELDERVAQRTAALAAESERVTILLRITTELSSSLDRDRVLNLALQLVNEVVHARDGAILLVDQENDRLVVHAALGEQIPLPDGGLRPDRTGLASWIIQNRRRSSCPTSAPTTAGWLATRRHGVRSALGVPLISGDDVLGVMLLTDPRPSRFTDQQLSLVEAAGIQAAGAIANASLYDLTRQQAERLGVLMRAAQVEVAKQQSILESIADGVLVDRRRR
jgi:GAF domain-containing protein